MKVFTFIFVFFIFIGEIVRIDPLMNGDVPAPSHLLSGTSLNGASMKKHGLHGSYLYTAFYNMKSRCYNSGDISYENYGARGITVCDEWRNNFKAFFDYVITLPNAMKPGYSIDRIDNNGNYEPGNIRWASKHLQSSNQRKRSDNTSGFIGIDKPTDKWRARIAVNGNQIHIGHYSSKEEAIKARNDYIINNNLTEYPLN